MEISDVRKRVLRAIDRAKRSAADRRARADQAALEYDTFLDGVAVPLFRQIASVLRAEGYPFSVSTPGGSVRLMSDRSGDDYVELVLDTSGSEPTVTGCSRRSRGRRVIESEQPIGTSAIRDLTEEDVLSFLLRELEAFVER